MVSQAGYVYQPSRYRPELGHPQLDFHLSTRPSGRFFDAHTALFYVAAGSELRKLVVHSPWPHGEGSKPQRVCAGRFALHAHSDHIIEGFSLGGQLEIAVRDEDLICRLTSPAPIFSLSDQPEAMDNLLVSEIEELFALQRAQWGVQDHKFEAQLVQADPMLLFAASLVALHERMRVAPDSFRGEWLTELTRIVNRAIHILKEAGDWPAAVPPLANQLGPGAPGSAPGATGT